MPHHPLASKLRGNSVTVVSESASKRCAKKPDPKMMLKRFPLRSTSGGSQRASSMGPGPQGQGLAPPQATTARPRARSVVNSESGRLSTRPASGSTGHRPGRAQSSTPGSTSQAPLAVSSRPVSPARSSDLDETISAGVRRRRDSSSDTTQLTPRRIKRLKTYAQQLASDRGIPLKKLLAFLENGDLYFMLLELRAGQIEREEENEANSLQELEKLLMSKDFESSLKNRLTACMLSPNLTAYVTDTHQHVMEFIQGHAELFKVSQRLFDDTELCAQLSKLVTRLLSTIRGQMKTVLTTSISKKTSITEAFKPLVHSGMEIDPSHWTRFAFLRRCLRIFLIGVGEHDKVSLKDLFSPYIIPSLHLDLRQHIEKELDVDIALLAVEYEQNDPCRPFENQDEHPDSDAHQGTTDATVHDGPGSPRDVSCTEGEITINVTNFEEDVDVDADANADVDADADADADADGIPDDEVDCSGFGLDGSVPKWTKQKFWNYVDAMLEQVRQSARHESNGDQSTYEKAYSKIMVEFVQCDLQEYSGPKSRRKAQDISSLPMNTMQPPWQQTIQKKLLW